jgi:cob(I)alamin adenosyltransferase
MVLEHRPWNTGYVQGYTGNGKGKTTAALRLALRAAGAGLRVFIAQFVKGMRHSEIEAFKRFPNLITVKQCGRGCLIWKEPKKEDTQAAWAGLEEVQRVLCSGGSRIVKRRFVERGMI